MKARIWMLTGTALLAAVTNAQQTNGCANLPDRTQLKKALIAARAAENSGLNAQQWATIVDRNGIVCAVAYTGYDTTTQLGIGRISSAMRANAANAFAFDSNSSSNGAGFPGGLALSTANLYSATQPGGFVGELPNNYPVNQAVFSGGPNLFGTDSDPMLGQPIGGFMAVGGGVGLFGTGQVAMGGLGVAGDHTCTDHDIAWRTRNLLNLDHLARFPPLSGDPARPDNIVYDITLNPDGGVGVSKSGLGHPQCPNVGDQTKLPAVRP
jgi:Haem-degrading